MRREAKKRMKPMLLVHDDDKKDGEKNDCESEKKKDWVHKSIVL
jgi:hypothetical protein